MKKLYFPLTIGAICVLPILLIVAFFTSLKFEGLFLGWLFVTGSFIISETWSWKKIQREEKNIETKKE
jgi:hypothetical protein